MVKVFCTFLGLGQVFSVEIDHNDTVSNLKHAIKEKKPELVYFNADALQVYRMWTRGGWIKAADADIMALRADQVVPDRIQELMGAGMELQDTWLLNFENCLRLNFEPVNGDVHILVNRPEDPAGVAKYDWRIKWITRCELALGALTVPAGFIGRSLDDATSCSSGTKLLAAEAAAFTLLVAVKYNENRKKKAAYARMGCSPVGV